MSQNFFDHPILNSPYEIPTEHWELDDLGQPTGKILAERRASRLLSPVPRPQKIRKGSKQAELELAHEKELSTAEQKYDPFPIINQIRGEVAAWRSIQSPADWQVTPETARLLDYWRHHDFQNIRPFFCQVEAVETMIWLTEVAPSHRNGRPVLEHIKNANADAHADLYRIALKLATGAGKTTVMAMLIAWQTINAVRRPASKLFTRGFLIVTPGITIKDRLAVLEPNHPQSYYSTRDLLPSDLRESMGKATIIITNYHAFKLREKMEVSKTGRALLQGRGPAIQTLETEGQMLQRVMPELMGMKNILVINDEAHHCYRERPGAAEMAELVGDEKEEAKENNEAARLWISGLEIARRKLGIKAVYDLSATPFFLRGSGYAEGTLFPWTVSDFSLMDAIESGIVKMPRIPIADNVPGADMPRLRNLWDHIGAKMPRKGRAKSGHLSALDLPPLLQTALDALYGHYAETFRLWQEAEIEVPPVFIVVANNTSTSRLIYEYIAGYEVEDESGKKTVYPGKFPLFRNFDDQGGRLGRPYTLLIDSHQLESGGELDDRFRKVAADEIEAFRRELKERKGATAGEDLTDQDLLREVMNTVGRKGRLGETIRCVVSVSMLTEGWDTNTVTHILGVRAFGTQLLCEQVVGRGLRRQSYDLNKDGRFDPEYADIFGIPFAFTAAPVQASKQKPQKTTQIHALPERAAETEIVFPRVEGYRIELPADNLRATFQADSTLKLTPELVGPSRTRNAGIIGQRADFNVEHLADFRPGTIAFHLAHHVLNRHFRDADDQPRLFLFPQIKAIVSEWLAENYLQCAGDTKPAQVLYYEIADMAAERIKSAITATLQGEREILAVLDPYNPTGSTRHINYFTSKKNLWATDLRKCHVNYVAMDSDWESEFCRVAEAHPEVRAYVKNQNLGLEVPYFMGARKRTYIPDFILQVDDGKPDPLNLIVEIKGYRGEDAKDKANAMRTCWVPGVNNLQKFGRWAFAEFTDVHSMDENFKVLIAQHQERNS